MWFLEKLFPVLRWIRQSTLVFGLALGILVFWGVDLEHKGQSLAPILAVMTVMVVWWLFESLPLAVTAMLPFFLFPGLKIMNAADVSSLYMNSTIFLFMGCFFQAFAMERWGLHRRIALSVLMIFGRSYSWMLFGFLAAVWILSMWISNTAATALMIPIASGVIATAIGDRSAQEQNRFAWPFFLGIAYAASIGGIATIVGTPPNLVLIRLLEQSPGVSPPGFLSWMIFALPLSLILLLAAWLYLRSRVPREARHSLQLSRAQFQAQFARLGPMSREQWIVMLVFSLTVLLWVTRSDLAIGSLQLSGWQHAVPQGFGIDDGVVAMAMATVLFIAPARVGAAQASRVLDSEVFQKVPWGVLLLFGGGFALAAGIEKTGLAEVIGQTLGGLASVPLFWVILLFCLSVTFLTEVTSNTAVAQILLPIGGAIAGLWGVNPMWFMIPIALSCSMAFMLPVATPPNALVFGSGRVNIGQMSRTGFLFNLFAAVLVSLMVYFWAPVVLGI